LYVEEEDTDGVSCRDMMRNEEKIVEIIRTTEIRAAGQAEKEEEEEVEKHNLVAVAIKSE